MIRLISCSIFLLICSVSAQVSAEPKSSVPQRLEVLGIEYPPFTTAAEEHGGICYVLLRDYLSALGLHTKLSLNLFRLHEQSCYLITGATV